MPHSPPRHLSALNVSDYKNVLNIIDVVYSIDDRSQMLQTALSMLRKSIGVNSAGVIPWNAATSSFQLKGHVLFNTSSAVLAEYLEHYADCDPFLEAGCHQIMPHNRAVKITDYMPLSKYAETKYARELAPLIPCFYEMNAMLNFHGHFVGGLALHRTRKERDFSERDRQIVNLVAPHLARALHHFDPQEPAVSRQSSKAKVQAWNLSRRQEEIAALVVQGYTNRQIGEQLFITEQTVKDHLRAIFEKTRVKRRTQLALSLLAIQPKRP